MGIKLAAGAARPGRARPGGDASLARDQPRSAQAARCTSRSRCCTTRPARRCRWPRRTSCCKLAEAHDLTIVEDDTYAWLAPTQAPRLAALDELQRTVYVSGFSKILTPNWRVGFLAASPALVERVIDTKLLTTLTTPALPERALAIMLEQGSLRRHAERVVQRACTPRASAACGWPRTPGFSLRGAAAGPVRLGRHRRRRRAPGRAPACPGLAARAGQPVPRQPRPSTLMRINFATAQEPRLWRALGEARDRLRDTREHGAAPIARAAYHRRRTSGHEATSPELP